MPWELFYADDLVLLAESRKILMEKIKIRKEGLESKGLNVNIGKTKVMKMPCGCKYAGQVWKVPVWDMWEGCGQELDPMRGL